MTDSVSSLREPQSSVPCPPAPQRTPGVSVRTLVLLLELLVAILSLQYLMAVRPAPAGVVWLEGRCPPPVAAQSFDGTTHTR